MENLYSLDNLIRIHFIQIIPNTQQTVIDTHSTKFRLSIKYDSCGTKYYQMATWYDRFWQLYCGIVTPPKTSLTKVNYIDEYEQHLSIL